MARPKNLGNYGNHDHHYIAMKVASIDAGNQSAFASLGSAMGIIGDPSAITEDESAKVRHFIQGWKGTKEGQTAMKEHKKAFGK